MPGRRTGDVTSHGARNQRIRPIWDASFLEQVAPAAAKVTVAEGEKKVQDLRIR